MAFSNYGNTGPFTNNTVPPGISATFLNNVENFLDQIISSAVADSHITADGAGNETAVSLTVTAAGTGLTVQHNALISGTLSVTGAATLNAAGTALSVAHNATISGTLTAPTIGGTTFTGVVNFNNTINLVQGSISRINFGFTAVTTGGTSISHGLGVVPQAVLITPSTNVTAWASSSMSSSTFTAFVSSNNNVWWLAIA
jgi:hypothetical protein